MAKSTAQADLRVGNVRISQDFIDMAADIDAPLPWNINDVDEVVDANGSTVCSIEGSMPYDLALMIVIAVNTCGSFVARRRVPTD